MLRNVLLASLAFTALATAPVAAQQTPASVTYYGNACAQAGHAAPDILVHPNHLPKLGGTLVVMYQGRNGYDLFHTTRPVLITGLQKVQVPLPKGPPIPGENLVFQPTNCTLYVTPDLLTYMPRDPLYYHNYESFLALPVPNNPTLIGFTFYMQWAAITISGEYGKMLSVALGNRAEITVGV